MNAFRDGFSTKVAQVRANPLESILLFFALATLAFAMYMTVVVALTGDRTQDLTFVGTTTELGRSLSASGPGHVGRLTAQPIIVGKSAVTVDTIVVVADSLNEPAFAQGGFVRDQIALYNDYAVRQAVLSSVDPSWRSRALRGTNAHSDHRVRRRDAIAVRPAECVRHGHSLAVRRRVVARSENDRLAKQPIVGRV